MECLKCGREAQPGEVFCPTCLDVMAKNPVKPDTPVKIHRRQGAPRKPIAMQKDQTAAKLALMQKRVRRLTVAIVILSIMYLATAGILGYLLFQSESTPDLGQNYSTSSTLSPDSRQGPR